MVRTAEFQVRGPQLFVAQANVQTDKTAEAMVEVNKEIAAIQRKRPPSQEELDLLVKGQTLAMAGRFERNLDLLSYILDTDRFKRPYNYAATLSDKYRALTPTELKETAQHYLDTDNLIWVVVGDLSKIEENVRELGFGEVEIWGVEGNRLVASGSVLDAG